MNQPIASNVGLSSTPRKVYEKILPDSYGVIPENGAKPIGSPLMSTSLLG